jgi:hypothetical protein
MVGSHSPALIARHKRLREFDERDFALLAAFIREAALVTIPNTMSETSNLLTYGVKEPSRGQLLLTLRKFSEQVSEQYVPSRKATSQPEYVRLGLADAAWLALLDRATEFLTADLSLYLAAQRRGLVALNFNHMRDA